MQGFKQPVNDFILKELAIVPLYSDKEPLVVMFEPPFSWQRLSEKYKRENVWLEHCFHGIPWNAGSFPYNTVGTILREQLHDAKKVHVFGSLRKQWLERFKFKIYDITDFGYPPIDKIKLATVCTNHNGSHKVNCALHNVRLYKQFLLDLPETMDWS